MKTTSGRVGSGSEQPERSPRAAAVSRAAANRQGLLRSRDTWRPLPTTSLADSRISPSQGGPVSRVRRRALPFLGTDSDQLVAVAAFLRAARRLWRSLCWWRLRFCLLLLRAIGASRKKGA